MDFANKILSLREEHHLTQEQLAERLCVTRQAVSKWERGLSYPSLDILRLIAKKFSISMNELLDLHQKEKSEEYKPIGYKNFGFSILYTFLFICVLLVIIFFNLALQESPASLWEQVFYNVLLIFIDLCVFYLLVNSLIPFSKVVIEYNDYGIRIKGKGKGVELPYSSLSLIEIRTHGNWNSGTLKIHTYQKTYIIYALKDLNQVKTGLDEIISLQKAKNNL